VNPLGSFQSFLSNDPITNIDVWRDQRPKVDIEKEFGFMKNKCPSGTTTHIFATGKIKDGKLDRTNIEVRENPRNKTDHVSYNPPMSSNPQQKVYDQMITAPRYCGNIESSVSWMPFDNVSYYKKMQERGA
jgi:hypothetical protein